MTHNYSQKTQDLIDRMCRNVERKDFELDKKNAEECILKTYDIFDLPRPNKIMWCVDIFVKKFQDAAGSAWSAGSARSAWSAWSAGSAWSARSAGSAGSARSAGSAGSAGSAWSAWSAIDYDFDWYVYEFEYCQNPDKENLPNENDYKYLEHCELLMQAKEYGLGYRVEYEGVLYLVPTPLVLLDKDNEFHSELKPAIKWKGGKEFYFLHGVRFEKDLFDKVVEKKLSGEEIMSMKNMEQRMIALKYADSEVMLRSLKGRMVEKSDRGNELWLVKDFMSFPDAYFLRYSCPSTGRIYVSGIDPEYAKGKTADECMSWKFGLKLQNYLSMKIES